MLESSVHGMKPGTSMYDLTLLDSHWLSIGTEAAGITVVRFFVQREKYYDRYNNIPL